MTSLKNKRLSHEQRDGYMEKGAFLIEFELPVKPFDIYREHERETPFTGDKPALLDGKKYQSTVDLYRVMERKGFRVVKETGCLIPDDLYSTYQEGSTLKGHQRSVGFFARFTPTSKDSFELRNEFGWPCTLQISHTCHRRKCCRIDHLIAEEQWRNLKRNYCGFHGVCDCGNEIPCIARYHSSDFAEMPQYCTTKAEVEAALQGAPRYVIRPPDFYAKRDAEAKRRKRLRVNREQRARAGSKSLLAAAKKQAEKARQGDGDVSDVPVLQQPLDTIAKDDDHE